MNLEQYNLEKNSEGKIELPSQFNEPISLNLIARSVITLQLNKRQPYGASPEAGTRVSAQVSRRRRAYRGSYGRGISRVPRKVLSRSGRQFFWQGALAPGTVKGRRAHPPKASTQLFKKINKKENNKAIRSALSAAIAKDFVKKRGHILPEGYPFVVNDSLASIEKTKIAKQALEKLGFAPELKRTTKKTVRAGRGKTRGRKYNRKIGPLIVVAEHCALQKSAANMPGVEIVLVNKLNAELLAPGTVPGRMILFTSSAINKIKNEKLFM
ncbi:50S ribosomal protein L4 [Candidatus Woesearchaeota archaeon]|nr:50S ribosomal protein L4 [Candidatus Woesearchaeota archaeon]|tara:strand:+ start:10294 stop:11100 length:807 start_codon:yes stop_codon:yes gene_type:complete